MSNLLPHHAGQGQCAPRGEAGRQHGEARSGRLFETEPSVIGRKSATIRPAGTTMRIRSDESDVSARRGALCGRRVGSRDRCRWWMPPSGATGSRAVPAGQRGQRSTSPEPTAPTRFDLGGASQRHWRWPIFSCGAGADVKAANEYGATALYAAAANADPDNGREAAGGRRRCQCAPVVGRNAADGGGRSAATSKRCALLLSRGADPNAQEAMAGKPR